MFETITLSTIFIVSLARIVTIYAANLQKGRGGNNTNYVIVDQETSESKPPEASKPPSVNHVGNTQASHLSDSSEHISHNTFSLFGSKKTGESDDVDNDASPRVHSLGLLSPR